MRWLTQSHLLMRGLLVLIDRCLFLLSQSLDTHKNLNLTPGFLLLSNYSIGSCLGFARICQYAIDAGANSLSVPGGRDRELCEP